MHLSFVFTTPCRAGRFDNKCSTWRRAFDIKLHQIVLDILAWETWASNDILTFFNLMLDVFQNKLFSRWIIVQVLK
jgi:hypothetical protein